VSEHAAELTPHAHVVRRVLIADDHPPFRAAVAADLAGSGFEVCAEADDAAAAVEAAVRERPELCLLDIRMPGSGIAAARSIAARVPGTKIVMLSASRSDEDVLDALEAGAAGYLLKDIEAGALATALERILAGEAQLPRRAAQRLLAELDPPARASRLRRRQPPGELTSRERSVLEAFAAGRSSAEVAADLGVPRSVVHGLVDGIFGKLRARRAADAR